MFHKKKHLIKVKIIIFIILNVFGFFLSTLGNLSYPTFHNINLFWPAGVIETVGAIFFGWTGVLAGTIFPVFSNFVTDHTYTSSLYDFLPTFIESFLPFYLFRKLKCDINLRGVRVILLFFLVGAIIPQFCGGVLFSSTLLCFGEITSIKTFFWLIFLWCLDAIPFIIIFGIPLIRIFAPILKEYGLLFGQPQINNENSRINQWKTFKNFPIFVKIFLSLITVGIVPISLFGVYEVIINKANTPDRYAIIICFGFFATLIITGLLTNIIISPIKKLSQGITKIAAGDFDYKVRTYNDDELGHLANAFNTMSRKLNENIRQKEKYLQTIEEHKKLAAIGEVAFGVAHDVKGPFTSMTSLLGLLPSLTPAEIKQSSETVDITMRKVLSLLDGITDYAREDKYDLMPGNILSTLDLSIKDISRYNPDKKVDFYYQLDILPLVNLDELRICRAFENIIANAFDFFPKKEGFMWFSTKAKGKTAEIVIGNSHSHIPDDKIEHLFEKMFTFGKKKGTGLGLGIVKKVIIGHNGKVFARNVEQPASFVSDDCKHIRGVEFVITLPLTETPGYELKDSLLKNSTEAKIVPGMIEKEDQLAGASEISTLTEKLKQQKPSLLILDDESIYRMRVRDVLKKLGELNKYVSTYDASSYKEAVAVLGQTKIDFLICDIDLMDRKHDGFSVLSESIDKYPTCRVLMHTNRKDPQDIKQAKKLGACGFCPKPITEAILVDLLLDNELWPNAKRKKASKRPTQNTVEYVKGIPNSVLLLVNDDAVILQYEKELLEKVIDPKDNIRIFSVKTYDEAIDIIRKEKVNILISDFYLDSETTGVEICKLVRRKNPVSVCIIASGIVTGERLKTQTDCVDEFFSVPPFNAKQQLETAFKMLQEKLNKQNA